MGGDIPSRVRTERRMSIEETLEVFHGSLHCASLSSSKITVSGHSLDTDDRIEAESKELFDGMPTLERKGRSGGVHLALGRGGVGRERSPGSSLAWRLIISLLHRGRLREGERTPLSSGGSGGSTRRGGRGGRRANFLEARTFETIQPDCIFTHVSCFN